MRTLTILFFICSVLFLTNAIGLGYPGSSPPAQADGPADLDQGYQDEDLNWRQRAKRDIDELQAPTKDFVKKAFKAGKDINQLSVPSRHLPKKALQAARDVKELVGPTKELTKHALRVGKNQARRMLRNP